MNPPDAGVGGGGAAGAASPGSGAADAGGSGGSTAPIKLTADTMVDLGDGQPARWADLTDGEKARFMPRDRYDRGVQYLTTEAQRLQKMWDDQNKNRGRQTSQQQQQQQQPHRDPFGTLRGRPVVDGDTIATTLEQMHREGFGPMAQAFAAMVKEVTDMKAQITETRQMFQPHQESRARSNFESMVESAIGKIEGIKGLPEGGRIDPKDPFIRDLAEDLHSSYEPDSWKSGEFEKMLKSRFEGAIAMVRAMDKAALTQASEIRRKGFFPSMNRGSGQGNGPAKYTHETGAQIAQRARDAGLFGGGRGSAAA